ncbi:hypothetical protein PBY51_016098 [Eleginops maclovinus]|uniref:Uncharacterized protein n=1 Tax=Eleginops maclovinus TaxID=56733 RepID=A0AAN7XPI7_ELEMC|nr:hypothetical protein PBY51_016098 [Eleginops maclovinus]
MWAHSVGSQAWQYVCVAEHTFETSPVCTEHQESSAHWPALQSPWETILGWLIGSGSVNNGMMGTANVRVKGQQGGLHV